MLKKAIIISIRNEETTLGLLPENCSEESSCHECGLCAKVGSNKELIKLQVKNFSNVSQGDIVEADVSMPKRSVIALAIYMLPLLFMFAGGYLGNIVFADTGMVIGGTSGFIISIFIIYILNNTALKLQGKIIRKL